MKTTSTTWKPPQPHTHIPSNISSPNAKPPLPTAPTYHLPHAIPHVHPPPPTPDPSPSPLPEYLSNNNQPSQRRLSTSRIVTLPWVLDAATPHSFSPAARRQHLSSPSASILALSPISQPRIRSL
ncbi:hypothetical protein PC9H_011798 [Pleurotus ostreatus]|uniref:Uncharacterized protein n=1 Tax=Pleurotus ostreatus TaxID=5322 RepID=A0A8H6ZJD4_PLEOS|nr:uncharacterized protein PC9H_011798 [Pleurotus ostreatus]KAF7421276.1 hypothetical protein PC9H_011798 [Pleurotus ostreatus]